MNARVNCVQVRAFVCLALKRFLLRLSILHLILCAQWSYPKRSTPNEEPKLMILDTSFNRFANLFFSSPSPDLHCCVCVFCIIVFVFPLLARRVVGSFDAGPIQFQLPIDYANWTICVLRECVVCLRVQYLDVICRRKHIVPMLLMRVAERARSKLETSPDRIIPIGRLHSPRWRNTQQRDAVYYSTDGRCRMGECRRRGSDDKVPPRY